MFRFASVRLSLALCTNALRRLSERLGHTGGIALVTALCAPVLVMIVGFVVDFGYASYINQQLSRAADAATVGSVSQTAATAGGGYGDLAFLQTMGRNYFNANIAQLGVSGVNFSLLVTSDGAGGVVASGSYSYNVPTFFAGILGINNIPVSGSAQTSARPLVYVNYYILVDTSQSMGIAATQADMNALYARIVAYNNTDGTSPGCVFGCHVPSQISGRASGIVQTYSNELLAHTPPKGESRINLRIDAAVSAIQSIINTASTVASATKNIQFALYAIQLNPNIVVPFNNNNLITQIAPLSSNYSSLNTAAATIDLGSNTKDGAGDSNFRDELAAFNLMLTANGVVANGSGASATSPLNYIFIVSDGASDVPGYCTDGHCTSAFDANNCALLKTKATVGTIYTTYNPIWTNNVQNSTYDQRFSDLIKNFTIPTDKLAQALQSCATSADYAFQANDGPDIITYMQALFQKTQPSSARISN